jgi:hypothetical protein
MAQGIFRVYGPERVLEPVIGADSEVFLDGTPVSINSSGFLVAGQTDVASSKLRLYGFCRQTVTMSSTNSTVAKVCPIVIAPDNVEAYAATDGTAITEGMKGHFAAVTVSAEQLWFWVRCLL